MGPSLRKPLPYTSDPLKLLLGEIWLFGQCSLPILWHYLGLLSIVWPLLPWGSEYLDEIYPWSLGNVWATFWHAVLFVLQLVFIVGVPLSAIFGLPFLPLLYTPALIACFVGFIVLNQLLCRVVLNGPPTRIFYAAGPKVKSYALDEKDDQKRHIPREHQEERWVFINGVAVGSHWLQSNLDRLATTFKRPILGIHNATYGVAFDVLECMIQRTFSYATLDIRTAYAKIAEILANKEVKKLVLVAHSQGCIEAGMVLDWLYATRSTEEVRKLEVYTFGNASNHWNCPTRADGPAIKHMEHYANEFDWVSRFGILHFRPLSLNSAAKPLPSVPNGASSSNAEGPGSTTVFQGRRVTAGRSSTAEFEAKLASPHRFVGRLFVRHASGHQFNQHYLDNILPMSWKNGSLNKVTDEDNSYMNQDIDEQALLADDTIKPRLPGILGQGRKIKDFSRLWQYVNGGVPSKSGNIEIAQVDTPVAESPVFPPAGLGMRN